jgi:hypothetical protein
VVYGEDSPEATADAVALAGLLDEIEPSHESERIYRKALEVWRRVHGPCHIEVATTLHNLAALRRDFGDHAEARRLFEEAHDLKLRLLGSLSPDTALTAACLAQLVFESGGGGSGGDSAFAKNLAYAAPVAYQANCQPDHPERIACARLVEQLDLVPTSVPW